MSDDKKPGLIGRWFGSGREAPDTRESPVEPEVPAAIERPSWFQRLTSGMSRSSQAIGGGIVSIFTKRKLDADTLEDHPETVAAMKDRERMDWLADPVNPVGNVQLPTAAVTANIHSLRDAIDAAMAMPANAEVSRSAPLLAQVGSTDGLCGADLER